jgi:predicted transcriptional regulator
MAGWSQEKTVQEVKAANRRGDRFEFKLHQTQLSKIENGDERVKIDYRTAAKIFEVLEREIAHRKKRDKRLASKVMIPFSDLLKATYSERVDEIIPKMKENDISQVPVMSGERIMGILTERSLLGKSSKTLVRECMEDPPPRMSASTPIRELWGLLRKYPMVLLEEKGELVGFVTAQDALPSP